MELRKRKRFCLKDDDYANEAEYPDTWAYIDENPAKWTEDDLFCPTP